MIKQLFTSFLIFTSGFSLADEQKYEWQFSYHMGVNKLHMDVSSPEREVFIKEKIRSLLSIKDTYCTNSSNAKKEIKKHFNGCDIFYNTKDGLVKAEITCDKLEYVIEIPQEPNESNTYLGKISLETKNEEFKLNSDGKVFLKRGKPCG